MKVTLNRYDDGSLAFSAGGAGEPYTFEDNDEDSITVAFTKAVNDIVESGQEVEGEAAVQVAGVLKAASGPVLGDGYNDLRDKVQSALPKSKSSGGEGLPYNDYYVQDIALDARHALICEYGEGTCHFVVPFDIVEGQIIVGDKSQWVPVEEQFVAKAGRMFSARNLGAMREAHEALGALIAAGDTRKKDEEDEETEPAVTKGGELSYTVQKADSQMRYTLGPLYSPMREDAHGEWIEDGALHKALHEYVRDSADSGRRINLQHGDKGDIQCGEWVECMRWPYDHSIVVKNAAGDEHEVEMPAGTIYLGVVWDEDYWDVEKSAPKGIDGYSLGGRAMKIRGTAETLKNMGYKVTKAKAKPHEYDGGKDGSGACTSCGMTKSEGNHL